MPKASLIRHCSCLSALTADSETPYRLIPVFQTKELLCSFLPISYTYIAHTTHLKYIEPHLHDHIPLRPDYYLQMGTLGLGIKVIRLTTIVR